MDERACPQHSRFGDERRSLHPRKEQRSAAPFRSAIATADRSRRYRTRFAAQHSARRHRRVPFSCQPSLSSLSFQSYPWPLCTVAPWHSPRPPHACSAVQCCTPALRCRWPLGLQRGVGCWWTEGPQEERIGPQGTRCLHSALRRVVCCLSSRWFYRIGHALPALSHHHRQRIPAARNKRKSAKRLSSAAH